MNTRQRFGDSTPQTKLLLSIDEAAAVLSLGRTSVYDLVMRQEIVSVKVGRMRRVPCMRSIDSSDVGRSAGRRIAS
jgi:excisionase family DNA binding protein